MSNNPVDSIVLGGIDQFIPQRQTEKEFLHAVDNAVREAIDKKDVASLGRIGASLLGIGQVTGIAFSQYVYTVEACWNDLKQRDDFYTWAEDKFGRDERTLERHQRIWAMFVSGDIPKEYVEKFKTMPIRVLIPIATLWNKGKYEITDLQWKKLSNAPDPTTVSKNIREIKGVESRKGTINIEWHRKQKEIQVWVDGKRSSIYLQYDENDSNAVAALDRLLGDGRVLEK